MPETFTVIRMALSSELMCAEVGGGLRHRPILNAGFYFLLCWGPRGIRQAQQTSLVWSTLMKT